MRVMEQKLKDERTSSRQEASAPEEAVPPASIPALEPEPEPEPEQESLPPAAAAAPQPEPSLELISAPAPAAVAPTPSPAVPAAASPTATLQATGLELQPLPPISLQPTSSNLSAAMVSPSLAGYSPGGVTSQLASLDDAQGLTAYEQVSEELPAIFICQLDPVCCTHARARITSERCPCDMGADEGDGIANM
jgi:hypothetical protein